MAVTDRPKPSDEVRERMKHEGFEDPRFMACTELLPRLGALSFALRYQDDQEPTVWIALAGFETKGGIPVPRGQGTAAWECAAALSPVIAMFRLCDQLVDGAMCTHCKRPAGFSVQTTTMPLSNAVCWYQYDPEFLDIKRSCERRQEAASAG